jgi:hypothetical protein
MTSGTFCPLTLPLFPFHKAPLPEILQMQKRAARSQTTPILLAQPSRKTPSVAPLTVEMTGSFHLRISNTLGFEAQGRTPAITV